MRHQLPRIHLINPIVLIFELITVGTLFYCMVYAYVTCTPCEAQGTHYHRGNKVTVMTSEWCLNPLQVIAPKARPQGHHEKTTEI